MELGPYLTINMNLLLSLRKKRNIPEGLLFDEHMHLFPILYLKNLSYSLPYPPVPFTSGSSSPGWLYLRNTQTPSALISFFCCATPHKQEKNQEKKNHQNNKSPNIHSVQCSAETILFKHLKACKAYSHEETSSQKKKKKKILNQFYSTFTEKFCCLLRFIVHLGFFRVWFLGFVFRF